MDTEEGSLRTGPAEDMDFTENDWLADWTEAKFGQEPRREDERTCQDLMRLRKIGREAARNWLEAEVNAGRLTRRDISINGKITALYRPTSQTD